MAPVSRMQSSPRRWRLRRPRRSRLVVFAAMAVGITGLVPLTATPAQALTVDVRVTISQVDALDSFEEPGDADFYAVTTIDGTERTSDQCQFEDDDHITPNWEFKKEGIDLSTGSVTVSIEIWDDDDNLVWAYGYFWQECPEMDRTVGGSCASSPRGGSAWLALLALAFRRRRS